ncbi:MAG: hydroxyisourate hydrolase [Candidatus Melainabacteria bacterium]|nr:hydroxyisourate hydrolase [Candidatus Melainabacteria bacterium]
MSGITTHVLDTSKGKPGVGVSITLEFLGSDGWKEIGSGTTNSDGRLPTLLADDHKLEAGTYRLNFDTKNYYQGQNLKSFYPTVPVTFEVEDTAQHYHVPLLLSPFGYSTYRGS